MRAAENLSNHILPVAATMVGVCMTVISVLQLIPKSGIPPWVDDLLSVDSLLFLVSAFMSYWALRHRQQETFVERLADVMFLTGLTLMVLAGFLVSFELFVN